MKPVLRRKVVRHFQTAFAVSERRASGFEGASHRYTSRRDPALALRMTIAARAKLRYERRRL